MEISAESDEKLADKESSQIASTKTFYKFKNVAISKQEKNDITPFQVCKYYRNAANISHAAKKRTFAPCHELRYCAQNLLWRWSEVLELHHR